MMKSLRVVLGAALGCVVFGLAGCTTNHDLPTLGGTASTQPEVDLEAVGKAYYDCMSDGGLIMELFHNDNKELAVAEISPMNGVVLFWDGEGGYGMSGSSNPTAEQREIANEFWATEHSGPALNVSGTDYTALYTRCMEETGYDPQAAQASKPYVPDPEQYQAQVDGNNAWAACAREHGWPEVEDSIMPADLVNGEYPTVYLPDRMTEQELRYLLDACPNFDGPQWEARNEWYNEWSQTHPSGPGDPLPTYPYDYLEDPIIAFGTPESNAASTRVWNPDEQDFTQADPRYAILREAQDAYGEAYLERLKEEREREEERERMESASPSASPS